MYIFGVCVFVCCSAPPPAVKYERIKFLVIALKNSVEIYAWAPKPYHKFMAFKVWRVPLSALSLCVPRSMRSNDSLRGTGGTYDVVTACLCPVSRLRTCSIAPNWWI